MTTWSGPSSATPRESGRRGDCPTRDVIGRSGECARTSDSAPRARSRSKCGRPARRWSRPWRSGAGPGRRRRCAGSRWASSPAPVTSGGNGIASRSCLHDVGEDDRHAWKQRLAMPQDEAQRLGADGQDQVEPPATVLREQQVDEAASRRHPRSHHRRGRDTRRASRRGCRRRARGLAGTPVPCRRRSGPWSGSRTARVPIASRRAAPS